MVKATALCESASAACAPEPVMLTWLVPLWLTIDTDPVVAAAAVGLKTTVNTVLCEGDKVRGALAPVRLRPVPVTPT